MRSFLNIGRIAGLLYLGLIVFGVFSYLFVHANLIVEGDSVSTANNILSSEQLFRAGFLTELLMITCWMFMGLIFYELFKSVNRWHARALISFILVASAITCLNTLNHIAALMMLKSGDFLQVFSVEQRQAMALFFLEIHDYGYYSAQIFFGLWLFPLGYLVFKSEIFSRMLSRFIGFFLMLGCFSYLIDLFVNILFPSYYPNMPAVVTIPPDIGEFSMCLTLLIKGATKVELKPTKHELHEQV